MDKFSPAELLKQNSAKIVKKKINKTTKYITKIVNGEKHLILNPDYTFKHND